MRADQVIKQFREEEKDAIAPYFWSDSLLLGYLNEAMDEYAVKTMSIYDDMSILSTVDAATGESILPYDERILDVIGASIGNCRRLRLISPGAASPCHGWPHSLVLGNSGRYMRLHPAPTEPQTVTLRVIRLPLEHLSCSGETDDIPRHHVKYLMQYMRYRAYGVQDGDTFNPNKSAQGYAEFERSCQLVYEEALRRRSGATGRIRCSF